jgi:hypothetical protein
MDYIITDNIGMIIDTMIFTNRKIDSLIDKVFKIKVNGWYLQIMALW